MPGDEHKIMNRAENRARSAIISSTKCIQTTVECRRTWNGILNIVISSACAVLLFSSLHVVTLLIPYSRFFIHVHCSPLTPVTFNFYAIVYSVRDLHGTKCHTPEKFLSP